MADGAKYSAATPICRGVIRSAPCNSRMVAESRSEMAMMWAADRQILRSREAVRAASIWK